MKKSISGYIKTGRTGMGFRVNEPYGAINLPIKKELERTGLGYVCYEMGRTQQNSIEKRFGRVVPGFIENFGRMGLGDTKQLGRVNPNSLAIKFGRTSAGCRKIEFSRQIKVCLSYETGRVVGGFRRISLGRQVSGNITQEVERAQSGDVKQCGRVIAGFVRGLGRITPNSIQCGRVVAGYIQLNTQAYAYKKGGRARVGR